MRQLRFVTATSLFDGHDVSINIMRRLLQSKGMEVIHLGHNRSVQEVVDVASAEDAHGVAVSSYQGGHNEYFLYLKELLNSAGADNIKIFGGGGGVITPKESEDLHKSGVTRIYSPEDGMKLGLVGIIDDMIAQADYSTLDGVKPEKLTLNSLNPYHLGKVITYIEEKGELPKGIKSGGKCPVLGITGTGGSGKSSLIDELLIRFHNHYPDKKFALISVDPTKRKTNGALLGDRIRLGSARYENVFVRSLATRGSKTELSPHIEKVVEFMRSLDFDLVMVETSGIGQASDEITRVSDKCIYVMTPEYGAQTQLEKIEMLEVANFISINKFERARSEDALRDVRKQYRRNHELFEGHPGAPSDAELPVFGTIASQFNDLGVNALFFEIASNFGFATKTIASLPQDRASTSKSPLIPNSRSNYLGEIAGSVRNYNHQVLKTTEKLKDFEALDRVDKIIAKSGDVAKQRDKVREEIDPKVFKAIEEFDKTKEIYTSGQYKYEVRGKEYSVDTKYTSIARQVISKVALPSLKTLAGKYKFLGLSNIPGKFPFAAGIFPFKRSDEDPKRQFAGEGGPVRTNKRFHYLSENDQAKRLSTAFDSVTLYGQDPEERPDIFGKIGESGVSICTLEDVEALFKGFDLTSPNTSVSMTINGPAPIMLAMFMNTAMRQNLKGAELDNKKKCLEVMQQVRGTVQADILKEDQAQNTCIFSMEFALKLMGDVQKYFTDNDIRKYYTVSISGYHIAEAGANPISQMAFTLSNGFTYVEYYLSRGLKIDDFCENLSFFFSNGLDPEYTVMGSVARKIWAVAMRDKYGASPKSQRFKYHVQTSGRSLHAQEINFNDIRTTLQAFLALSDNCNSLHTNAYDEAVTTPTEESVRRAMAIQMIINREFGLNKTDNPIQGAYLFEELCEIVEEAVLSELERLSDKGGVLSAMESMYQRSKIQEESLYYENLKDSGEMPIIGVNTYLADNIQEKLNQEIPLSRSTAEEKQNQIKRVNAFKDRNKKQSQQALDNLKQVALSGGNVFEELLKTVRHCSLGQITNILYDIGGYYRRNI